MHSIYIIKNTINNKVYIGQTIKTIQRRFVLHKAESRKTVSSMKISRAMKKYGIDNFYIELLDICETQEQADKLEIFHIKNYNSTELGYNITGGGKNTRIITSAMKIILSNNRKGKKHSLKSRKLISIAHSGERNFFYGKSHSDDVKQFLSECRRGENNLHAKLTEENVINIITLLKENVLQKEIAKMFSIHNAQVSRIKNNKIWKHLPR